MAISEFAWIVIAASAACIAVAAVLLALRLTELFRHIEAALVDIRGSLKRVDAITGEIEILVRNARRLEDRVGSILDGPLRTAGAVVEGLGAAFGALARPRVRHTDSSPPQDGPGAEETHPSSRPAQRRRNDHE